MSNRRKSSNRRPFYQRWYSNAKRIAHNTYNMVPTATISKRAYSNLVKQTQDAYKYGSDYIGATISNPRRVYSSAKHFIAQNVNNRRIHSNVKRLANVANKIYAGVLATLPKRRNARSKVIVDMQNLDNLPVYG